MKKIFISVIFLSLFSCQRAEKDQTTKVVLRFSNALSESANDSSSKIDALKLNPNQLINPAGMSDINCYGLLISGPDEALKRNTCKYSVLGTSFPVGFFAGGFFPTGTDKAFTVEIPSGKDRVIRLVGFKADTSGNVGLTNPLVCTQFRAKTEYETYLSDPFVIAEAGQLELPAGGTKDVSLTAVFSAANKLGDCSGPDFNSNSGVDTNGPPAKIAFLFQDGSGITGKPLRNTSCVGVKLQLQDTSGNRANLTSNPLITAKIKTTLPGSSVGDFFLPNPGNTFGGCQSSDLTTVDGSGDITISFHNGSNAFSDLNLFFRPSSIASHDLSVFETTVPNKLTTPTTNLTFVYDSSAPTATKYGFYDFYNNVSTSSVDTATKMSYVRRNECRPAWLQFMDENSVPMKGYSGSVPRNIVVSDTATAGEVSFYPTSADCTNGVAVTDQSTIALTSLTYYYSYPVFYKVTSNTLTNFGFTITNSGGGTDVISSPSGDLTSGSNFWGVF